MTKYSLRARMMTLILVPALIVGLLLSGFFAIHRYNQLQDQLAEAGANIIEPLAANSAYALARQQPEALRQLVDALHRRHSNIVRAISVFNTHNQPVAESASREQGQWLPLPSGAAMPSQMQLERYDDCLILRLPLLIDGEAAPLGYVALELDLNSIKLQQYREMFIATLLLLLCVGVALLFAYRLMRDVTQPINDMADTVDRIRRGQLDSRVSGKMLGELEMLKNGINSMAMSLSAYHEEMQQNIDQATYDLRETLEQMEIQNVELDLAKKRAQEAARIKSEFLANISHELRTPLNAVIGFTRQTLKTTLTPTQQDYLHTIERSANNLLHIINDVLDFSKLEAGKLALESLPFSLHNTLDEIVILLAHTAHEKGLELTLNIHRDVPEQVIGDPLRLQQIVTNLLGNAIKFTEQGNIDIRIEKRQQEQQQLRLLIQIKDTGIGITETQQTQLFQAFHQADARSSRRHGGTGLGLVITQRLVREMGGDIRFHSQPNQGTTFWCTVNLTLNPNAPQRAARLDALAGQRLAYVEANPAAAQATLDMLADTPLAVTYSPTLAQLPAGDYDIMLVGVPVTYRNILPDCMPKIRQICGMAPRAILVLPSLAQMSTEQLKSAGVYACPSKPLTRPRLFELLQDEHLPTPAPSERLPLRVMAVDDNPANLKLIGALLEERVERVIRCNSGADAVGEAEWQTLDLILMDIQMPDMDGIEASKRIRQLPHHARTPIVAVTAHALDGEREQLLNAGMSDYLTKPIDEQMLQSVLRRYAGQQPSGDGAPGLVPPPSLDWKLAQRQAANKTGLARDLLHMLLTFLPQVRQQVEAQLDGRADGDLLAIVHKLHGSCSYSGVPRLQQLCRHIEQQLRQGAAADELEPEWLELLDEMSNVEQAAQPYLAGNA